MGSVLRDLFTGVALLIAALMAAIILIPALVALSALLHVVGWFLSAVLSILLLIFVLWGIGFLYRMARRASKDSAHPQHL